MSKPGCSFLHHSGGGQRGAGTHLPACISVASRLGNSSEMRRPSRGAELLCGETVARCWGWSCRGSHADPSVQRVYQPCPSQGADFTGICKRKGCQVGPTQLGLCFECIENRHFLFPRGPLKGAHSGPPARQFTRLRRLVCISAHGGKREKEFYGNSNHHVVVEGRLVKNYPLFFFSPRCSKVISPPLSTSPPHKDRSIQMTRAFRTIHFNPCLTSGETKAQGWGWLLGSLSMACDTDISVSCMLPLRKPHEFI